MIRDAMVACTQGTVGTGFVTGLMVALPFSKEGSLGQGGPCATSEGRVWEKVQVLSFEKASRSSF